MSYKVVVFSGNLTYSVRKGIVEIDRAIPNLSWLIVLHSPGKNVKRILRNQWRNYRRNGWRWIPYQTAEVFQRLRGHNDAPPPSTSVGNEYTSSALRLQQNVHIIEVADIHAESTIKIVKEFAPDLGLSLAAPVLKRPLFSLPRLGTLNLHKGRLPNYRGMPPAFWEMWNNEKSVGCSVHWVDEKLDTGAVVAQSTVEREKFSTVHGLQLCLDEAGVSLMRDAVRHVFGGTVSAVQQAPGGATFRKPTLAQIAQLNRKMLLEQKGSSSYFPKQLIKDAAAESAFAAWRLGIGGLAAPRISVLLYHRVSDTVRDNLTVGIEQFDRHMGIIREYFQPISIEDVVACGVIPKAKRPLVCVTFDDGYLDNYTNAAPVMLRHQVPGAFFVATGIVNTDHRFPHDVRRKNPPIPVMSWEQLQELRKQGFTIGSHSVSHINCAQEPEETVWNELVRSFEDLRRELSLSAAIFAYPYGGREHMTSERLELVKKAGYSACLSAYGGTNIHRVDPFNVLRRGIQWEFSDHSFLLECLGLT